MKTYQVGDAVRERIGAGEDAPITNTKIVDARMSSDGRRLEVATSREIWYDSVSGVRVDKATPYASVAHVPAAAGGGG